MCVSGYREAITTSQTRAAHLAAQRKALETDPSGPLADDNGRPIRAKVGRVLGRLRRGRIGSVSTGSLDQASTPDESASGDRKGTVAGRERETLWKLKTLAKVLIALCESARVLPLLCRGP